jgi:hypothetical protein
MNLSLEKEIEAWIMQSYPEERQDSIRHEFYSAVDFCLDQYLSQGNAREIIDWVQQDQQKYAEKYGVNRGTDLLDRVVLEKLRWMTLN